jgi:hypothetical protein
VFDVHEPINPVQIAAFPTPADQDYCKKGAKFGRAASSRTARTIRWSPRTALTGDCFSHGRAVRHHWYE